jgi:hypothetical protein
MATASAGSLIFRPSWDWRPAIGNALAGGGGGGGDYSARRILFGTVLRFCLCLTVDLQAKRSDGPTTPALSATHS